MILITEITEVTDGHMMKVTFKILLLWYQCVCLSVRLSIYVRCGSAVLSLEHSECVLARARSCVVVVVVVTHLHQSPVVVHLLTGLQEVASVCPHGGVLLRHDGCA